VDPEISHGMSTGSEIDLRRRIVLRAAPPSTGQV
jgi:hypothetical protein